MSDDGISSSERRRVVQELSTKVSAAQYELGKHLYIIHHEALYLMWGYESFYDYIEGEAMISWRQAMYIIKTYRRFALELGDESIWHRLKKHGFTKVSRVAPAITPNNVDAWDKAMSELSSKALESAYRAGKYIGEDFYPGDPADDMKTNNPDIRQLSEKRIRDIADSIMVFVKKRGKKSKTKDGRHIIDWASSVVELYEAIAHLNLPIVNTGSWPRSVQAFSEAVPRVLGLLKDRHDVLHVYAEKDGSPPRAVSICIRDMDAEAQETKEESNLDPFVTLVVEVERYVAGVTEGTYALENAADHARKALMEMGAWKDAACVSCGSTDISVVRAGEYVIMKCRSCGNLAT